MRVRCIRIVNQITGQEVDQVCNDWLRKGEQYVVLEVYVYVQTGNIFYRIKMDIGSPPLFSADQFLVIDGTMPPNWQLFYEENNVMILRPKSWHEPAFWEDYFDGVQSAEDMFEKEHVTILSNS